MDASAASKPADRAASRFPAYGFGAASLGNLYHRWSDADATGALDAALAAGMGYVDTAPFYGHGLSERRIGAWLAASGARPLLSTKVGRLLRPIAPPPPGTRRQGFVDGDPNEAVFDYGHDGVLRSFEASLTRLRRDRVDLLLAHDLGEATHGERHAGHMRAFLDGGYRAMRTLRAERRVERIGLGVNETAAAIELLRHCDLDVILLAGRYTLLEQGALDVLLPLCLARGVAVVIGGAFNSGILYDGGSAGATARYDYAPPPPAILARVEALEAACARHGVPLAAAAIQFPLGHPAVVSVLSGLATAGQVQRAVQLQRTAIPAALWAELRERGLIAADAPTPAETEHRTCA